MNLQNLDNLVRTGQLKIERLGIFSNEIFPVQ